MTDDEIYRKYALRYPNGKPCPKCGRVLSVEAFGTNRQRGKGYLQSYCSECNRLAGQERHRKVYQRKRSLPPAPITKPLEMPRMPIPTLEVGRVYEVVDRGFTGAQYEGRPAVLTYRGPCVGRWGRNWGIKTSTGIRCFTPATLVGLQVKEVERIA